MFLGISTFVQLRWPERRQRLVDFGGPPAVNGLLRDKTRPSRVTLMPAGAIHPIKSRRSTAPSPGCPLKKGRAGT